MQPVNLIGSGDQMPKAADPISFEDIEKIRAWIDQGALDN